MEKHVSSDILSSNNLKVLFNNLLSQSFLEKYQGIQNSQIESKQDQETQESKQDQETQESQESEQESKQDQETKNINKNYLFHLSGGIIISIICFHILISKLKKKKKNINKLNTLQI